jgi:photosystem II stability/assembly factor-like uncharacterized protein
MEVTVRGKAICRRLAAFALLCFFLTAEAAAVVGRLPEFDAGVPNQFGAMQGRRRGMVERFVRPGPVAPGQDARAGGFGDWQCIGPEGAYVQAMAMHPAQPSVIYLAPQCWPARVYRSTDAGQNWSTRAVVGTFIFSLATSPVNQNTLYAAGYADTALVWTSTDAGLTWLGHAFGGPGHEWDFIYSLAVDPVDSSVVWGAADYWVETDTTYEMAVYRSPDCGFTWYGTPLVLGNWGAGSAVAVDPVGHNTVYVAGQSNRHVRVFRTTDGGLNWTGVSENLTGRGATSLAVHPTTSGTVLVGTDSGVFRSTNRGTTWTQTAGFECYSVRFSTSNTSVAYAGSHDFVYKSTNGGVSWFPTAPGIYGHGNNGLLVDPTSADIVYAGNKAGVFKTVNGGASWQAANWGLQALLIRAVTVCAGQPSTLYASAYGNGVYRSTNRGSSWTRLSQFMHSCWVGSMAVEPQNPNVIYALPDIHFYGGFSRSTDGGQTWTDDTIRPFFIGSSVALDPSNPLRVYVCGALEDTAAGTLQAIFAKSTDAGHTWTDTLFPETQSWAYALAIDPDNSGTIYVGGSSNNEARLAKSTDFGATWADMDTGLTGWQVNALALNPRLTSTLYASTGDGVFKSTDGGGHWTGVGGGYASTNAFLVDPGDTAIVYAGGWGGIMVTTDGGTTWSAWNQGLNCDYVNALAIDTTSPARVYVGTYGGSVSAQAPIGVEEGPPVNMSPGFGLELVVPAPTRRAVWVSYRVPTESRVALEVFDLSGRFARTLVSRIQKPGAYSAHWDGTDDRGRKLPSGVYFVRLVAGEFRTACKLLMTD